jgi:hypothetical protein
MPEVMTFTSLKEDLRRYIERGNSSDTTVAAQLPRIVNQAERAIATKLKVQGLINVYNSSLTAGVSVYAKPDRWRKTVSMEYGAGVSQNDRTELYPRSYEYCRSYWPNSDEQAAPQYYADYQYSHWLVVPTPIATVPWQIIVYEQPQLLDDSNQTNWLTDYAPNALLYRCLLELAPFLNSDDRLQTWTSLYTEAIGDVNLQDLEKIVDRNVNRTEA